MSTRRLHTAGYGPLEAAVGDGMVERAHPLSV